MKELYATIIVATLFALSTFLLLLKVVITNKGLKDINTQLPKIIDGDTNALISISSSDKQVKKLACLLNDRLKQLRENELTYINGDRQLKNSITNVAHDIRTPLTAICGYAEMMKDEKDPAKLDKYLSIISQRANDLKLLSEELFKFSVATNKTYDGLDLERVDVNDLLQETLFSFYDKFNERGIVPKLTCQNAISRITDKNCLIRIFSNIMDNAVKYSDGDFSISIMDDGKIAFSNTAVKLNNVDVGRLFDRFYTVESGKNSTGLGLSIAKQLTKKLGGDISAQYENHTLTILLKI